ncbi:MAG: hypothetical protein QOI12_160 [Alphaproteobacteria bacterium]|jgi:hypothetical protein|nr:hypothetical protein [Alphaproteobacteria bacterium]
MTHDRHALAAALLLVAIGSAGAQDHPLPIEYGFPDGKSIDIAGFYFGMTGAQARQRIPAHYEKQKSKPGYVLAKMPITNEAFLRLTHGDLYAGNISYDNIALFFSAPPSGNQAVFIRRSAHFLGNDRPNRAATLAAIREKLGEPSRTVGNHTMEFYFAKGRTLTQADGSNYEACNAGRGDLSQVGIASGGLIHTQDDILLRYLTGAYRAMQNAKGACDIYIRTELSGSYDQVGNQSVQNENAIGRLNVMAFDYARFFATQKYGRASRRGHEKQCAPDYTVGHRPAPAVRAVQRGGIYRPASGSPLSRGRRAQIGRDAAFGHLMGENNDRQSS